MIRRTCKWRKSARWPEMVNSAGKVVKDVVPKSNCGISWDLLLEREKNALKFNVPEIVWGIVTATSMVALPFRARIGTGNNKNGCFKFLVPRPPLSRAFAMGFNAWVLLGFLGLSHFLLATVLLQCCVEIVGN